MYTEKIHRIVNAKCKNAGKRQSMLKKCSESSVQGERMFGIVNARYKNTRKRQCKDARMLGNGNVKVQGCWEMAMYTEKCSELSMQSGKMLGIIDARRKNTRNRQCTQKKYTESSMQSAIMLGNDKVC